MNGTAVTVFKQVKAAEDFFDDKALFEALPVHSMIRQGEGMKTVNLTVVKSDDKEATVNYKHTTGFKNEFTLVFTNVEGKWLDKKLVEEWPRANKDAKAGLEFVLPFVSKEGKPAALDFLGKIDKSLDTLAAAKTADDFNKEVLAQIAQFQPKPPQ